MVFLQYLTYFEVPKDFLEQLLLSVSAFVRLSVRMLVRSSTRNRQRQTDFSSLVWTYLEFAFLFIFIGCFCLYTQYASFMFLLGITLA